MISITTIKELWKSISPHVGSTIARRPDASHPVEYWIGYDEDCNMEIVFVADKIPDLPLSSEEIFIRGNKRSTDNNYAICLSLKDLKLQDMFISLTWDLMASSSNCQDSRTGVCVILKRLRMWQQLFSEKRSVKMSEQVGKGLLGELLALRNICISKYGVEKGEAGWIGPLRSDRDFEFADWWYEVKTTSLSKQNVLISSFDQLDADTEGSLLICRVEKTTNNNSGAVSLNTLINEIEEVLADKFSSLTSFRIKLSLLNYDNKNPVSDYLYQFHGFDKFTVKDEFPRLRRSRLETAIENGEYLLSISALNYWKE